MELPLVFVLPRVLSPRMVSEQLGPALMQWPALPPWMLLPLLSGELTLRLA